LAVLVCFRSSPGLATADQYEGDTDIYGVSSTYVRPNVLIIIDNSVAAANSAAGSAYDKTVTYSGNNDPYDPYDIYEVDQQGDFSKLVSDNTTASLENLNCPNNDNIVKNTLLTSGTYTSSGTQDNPNLKLWQGVAYCDTPENKGSAYALGNYLNYLSSSPADGDSASQIEIVYDALETVLNGARYAVNFGAMVYGSNNKGGNVIAEIADLQDDTDFAAFLAKLPGSGEDGAADLLDSTTARPQAEALLDAGYYYRGMKLPISQQSAMTSPITEWCGKNFIILITNGLTNKDNDPLLDDITLGELTGDLDGDGMEPGAYGAGSHYLDDVAKLLHNTDANTADDMPGTQNIITHTILAFQNEDPLIRRAADASHGGGSFYNVFNANQLAKALQDVLVNIVLEADTSFVAPVVPTSPENRTYSGERVYMGFFKPMSQKMWHGNLKKYGLDSQLRITDKNGALATNSDGSFSISSVSYWSSAADGGEVEEGGVGGMLLNRDFSTAPRAIYTYLGSNAALTHSSNAFNIDNLTAASLGVSTTTERDALVNFIYGYDVFDENGDGSTTNKRSWIMGDILHSKPLVQNYNTYSFNATNEANSSVNKTVIFVGDNDGMLHAFRDSDGKELWAFIPPNLLSELHNLTGIYHNYYVDATPVAYVYDHDGDGNIGTANENGDDGEEDSDDGSNDKVILLFGQRRGGNAYYALDVTDPTSPRYLWKIDTSTTGFSELGQTWSTPRLAKVKDGTATKVVAIVGAGYDNANEDRRFGHNQAFTGNVSVDPADSEGSATSAGSASAISPKGRGLFAFAVATLDSSGVPTIASTPSQVWEFTPGGTAINSHDTYNRTYLTYSFPTDVAMLDTDGDGYVDRLYAGDTGGRMWRISAHYTSDGNRPYASANIQNWFGKIIFSANGSTANTGSADVGRKLFFRPSVTAESGYYGVYFGTGDRAHPLNLAVTDRIYAVFDRGQRTSETITETNLVDVTTNLLQDNSATADQISVLLTNLSSTSNYGWYIKLNEHSGEKVLAEGLVFDEVGYFTTYTPNTIASEDPCATGNLGVSRLYAVDYLTGEAVLNFYSGNDSDSTSGNARASTDSGTVLRRADRSVSLGVGIPSGVVMVMTLNDDKILISSGGGLWTGDPTGGGKVMPIYWMQW
jgi:type IV pilus assembly protein PilY1